MQSMIRFRHIVCSAVAACALSSCYTNFNQALLGGGKQYEGYLLDYRTDAASGEKGLVPVLYRCGDDWYMAGIKCGFEKGFTAHLHYAKSSKVERMSLIPVTKGERQVYYHKITSEMAKWMITSDQASRNWYCPMAVDEEMKRAGGGWRPTLPPGAKAVPADFLKYCKTNSYHVTKVTDKGTPALAYPLGAAVFLAIDVPLTVTASALYPVVYVARKLNLDPDDLSKPSKDNGIVEKAVMILARHDRQRNSVMTRHGNTPGGGESRRHERSGSSQDFRGSSRSFSGNSAAE